VTNVGGKILIVTVDEKKEPVISALDIPELNTEQLDKLIRGGGESGNLGGWLAAYNLQYEALYAAIYTSARKARVEKWRAAIDDIGPSLWKLFAGRLDEELQRRGIKLGGRLIWLPTGALGLLPIALARDVATDRQFLEAYEIANAPSLDALASASALLKENLRPSLAEVTNPSGNVAGGDLPYAEIEGALVASLFSPNALTRLDKTNATQDAVFAALRDRTYWHFSSHGFFDWNDARKSGIRIKDDAPLTISAFLDKGGSLGRPRLVAMSACETGLYDTKHNTDEFVGLPATFMQLGAAGVVATLWQVDDLATALLMAKFYELHVNQGLRPASALKQAQDWLRAANATELIAFGKSAAERAKLDPEKVNDLEKVLGSRNRSGNSRFDDIWNVLHEKVPIPEQQSGADQQNPPWRPFAHPYYWGGFVYTGL
jgi:CHAT domain-containing protein